MVNTVCVGISIHCTSLIVLGLPIALQCWHNHDSQPRTQQQASDSHTNTAIYLNTIMQFFPRPIRAFPGITLREFETFVFYQDYNLKLHGASRCEDCLVSYFDSLFTVRTTEANKRKPETSEGYKSYKSSSSIIYAPEPSHSLS